MSSLSAQSLRGAWFSVERVDLAAFGNGGAGVGRLQRSGLHHGDGDGGAALHGSGGSGLWLLSPTQAA